MDRSHATRRFGRVVWLGIGANMVLSFWGLLHPESLLATVGLEPATPTVWPRFASLLLILLSLFYVPAARDPVGNRLSALLTVGARAAGVVFFGLQGGPYVLFGLYDLTFGLPQAVLLARVLRPRAIAAAAATDSGVSWPA